MDLENKEFIAVLTINNKEKVRSDSKCLLFLLQCRFSVEAEVSSPPCGRG